VESSLVQDLKHKAMKPEAINYSALLFTSSHFMKKIFVLGIILALSLPSYSQGMRQDLLTSDYYLQKSKSQKITGFILLGIGVTTLALLSKGETDFDILPVLAIGGITATVVSIPLLISAHINKRKAVSLSVKEEKAFILHHGSFAQKSFPSISVRLDLRH
jgi:hypothetical protein